MTKTLVTNSALWLKPEAVIIPDVNLGPVSEYGNYDFATVLLDGTEIGTIAARPGQHSGVQFTVHAWGSDSGTAQAWNLNAAVELLLEHRQSVSAVTS